MKTQKAMPLILFIMSFTILSSSLSLAGEQILKIKVDGIKFSGTFPLNLTKPLLLSGFDEQDRSYQIQVTTKRQGQGKFEVKYQIDREAKKDKSGSLIVLAGQKGALSESNRTTGATETLFETTITE